MMITWRQFERGVCLLLGTVHFLLGFVTWVGGEARFPAPGYTPLLQLSHGVVWPYGLGWMLGGLFMIVFSNNRFRLVGIGIVIVVSNLWAALFCLAAYQDPHAPFTPVIAYSGYGLLNAALAAIIIAHRGREDGKV